eukprot:scaffold6.g2714.t1
MATAEYLSKFMEAGRRYEDLPARIKLTCTPEEWRRQVKDFCIHRSFAWASSVAATVCAEYEYYEELMRFYRTRKRLFPYHLSDYVCRVMRVSPFRYYISILADTMREDLPYDSIPNFTAADIVRIVGIGRNEYIATMVQAKSKKLLWRMNKGIVKDLLPQEPLNAAIDPWWVVHVVNVGEAEFRQLDPLEVAACHAAARPGGTRYSDLNPLAVAQLYRRGLVWLEVPVSPDDHLSIPPLEGFVSNKTTAAGAADADPLEALLYQVFVAASDRVTVSKLASILGVDVHTLTVAISTACRLRFCRKLDASAAGAPPAPGPAGAAPSGGGTDDFGGLGGGLAAAGLAQAGGGAAGGVELDLDHLFRSPEAGSLLDSPLPDESLSAEASAASSAGGGAAGGGTGVAFVVDSEVTGYLMMGALTPGCKKHSVTLFEGGRVYGADVLAELLSELRASVEMSAGFEGEMRSLAGYARSLAIVLDCLVACAGGRPIELLRKESVGSLAPPAAYRILSHSYGAVLPITTLAFPPLPLSLARPDSPVNYGPTPAAATPWLHLALYAAARAGPRGLVLAAGQQFCRLPAELAGASHVLLWPWDCEAVRAQQGTPVIAEAQHLLFTLNEHLARTALLAQPVQLAPRPGASASQLSGESAALDTIDVPLPLPPGRGGGGGGTPAAGSPADDSGWNPFAEPRPRTPRTPPPGSPAAGLAADLISLELNGAGGSACAESAGTAGGVPATVAGYRPSGEAEAVQLPPGFGAALAALGLSSSLGHVRLLRALGSPAWAPLQLCLGMPMQPCELCQAVCDAARGDGFLGPRSRRAQREGQAALQAALDQLIAAHGGGGDLGGGDDPSSFVARPARNLAVSEGGAASPADLSAALQGLATLA